MKISREQSAGLLIVVLIIVIFLVVRYWSN